MNHSTQIKAKGLKPGLVLSLLALLVTVPSWAENSYSYARVVEGPSTVIEAGGNRESVEPHQPILVGDRLWVPYNSRMEVVLSDRTMLRIEGESELFFDRIAYSSDSQDRKTVLRLAEGNMQLIVPDYALGDTLPQLETPSATIYLHREGSFRIAAGRNGWAELVVREGLAELVTDNGSLLVHAGETGVAEGGSWPRLDLRNAGNRDSLERWGDRLTEEAALAERGYVDEPLRYAAAPLAHHGAWVSIDSRRAWRPRVEVSWRPYHRGHWRQTPIGLTWVSNDPWGWVTHHYGSWDYVRGYGWLWYPGPTYAPARVHWYWGPDYVGWCPSGFYSHHYRRNHVGFGLHFGHYGWAGGSWDSFSHWNFTSVVDFGHRHRHRHVHSGFDLARMGRELHRGIITTDPGRRSRRPHEVFEDLKRDVDRTARAAGRTIPDVTDFVGRKPLRNDVAKTVLRKSNDGSDRRDSTTASGTGRSAGTRYPVIKSPKRSDVTKAGEDSGRRSYRGSPRVGYDDRDPESRTSATVLRRRSESSDRTSGSSSRTPTVSTERWSRPGSDDDRSSRDRSSGKRDDLDVVARPAPADRSGTLRRLDDRSSSSKPRTPSISIERRRPSSDDRSSRDRSGKRDAVVIDRPVARPAPADRSSSSRSSRDRASSYTSRTPSVSIERRRPSSDDRSSRDRSSSRPSRVDSSSSSRSSRDRASSGTSSRTPSVRIERPEPRRDSGSRYESSRPSSRTIERSKPEPRSSSRSQSKPEVRRRSSSDESSSRGSQVRSKSPTRSRPERKAPPRSRPKPQKPKKEKDNG
ncbi:MAG: FecR domain-containing protein [bacterium]|nr:FecR domain-containing protein [bacterium]